MIMTQKQDDNNSHTYAFKGTYGKFYIQLYRICLAIVFSYVGIFTAIPHSELFPYYQPNQDGQHSFHFQLLIN